MNLEVEHGQNMSKPKQTTTVSFRDIRKIPQGFMDSTHPKMWVEMGQAFPYQLHPSAPSIHHFSLAQKNPVAANAATQPMHPLIHSEPPPSPSPRTAQHEKKQTQTPFPCAPCMEYLPPFTP